MPIIESRATEKSKLSVYRFDESDRQYLETFMDPDLAKRTEGYHQKKVLENLMVRALLAETLPGEKIKYRENGQPYLRPSQLHISISHSFPLAGIAVSEVHVGIDLERLQPKIARMKHKFLFPTEFEWTANEKAVEYLTAIWAIKESLYKIHPSKYWSLKEHYEVLPFSLEDRSAIRCRVFDAFFDDHFTAQITEVEDCLFAVIEKDF